MSQPSRLLPRSLAALFASFSAIAASHAEKRPAPGHGPEPAEERASTGPIELSTGLEGAVIRVKGNGFTRVNHLLGIGIFPVRRLKLSTGIRVGHVAFAYRSKPGSDPRLSGDLSKDGHPTLSTGLDFVLREGRRVRSWIFAEYETSFGSAALNVDAVTLGLGDSSLDLTNYIREHGTFSFAWRRFTVGTGLRVETGRVSPTLSVAYERLAATVDVGLDDESRDTLTAFGKDASSVEKRHSIDRNTASFFPGIDIRLTRRLRLSVEGMIVPVRDGWAFGAGATCAFRP